MKAIRKNQLVEKTVEYLSANIPETHVNRGSIFAFKAPNNIPDAPYIMVTTSTSHPQPDQESQQKQLRYVNLSAIIYYPLNKTDITKRTTDDQNQQVDTKSDTFIAAQKSVNDTSDDIIETLYNKAYITAIESAAVAIVNEGEAGIDTNSADMPLLVYTVEINTQSLLTF